jgi:hypothetical protein
MVEREKREKREQKEREKRERREKAGIKDNFKGWYDDREGGGKRKRWRRRRG